jgi:hypothetical protein
MFSDELPALVEQLLQRASMPQLRDKSRADRAASRTGYMMRIDSTAQRVVHHE